MIFNEQGAGSFASLHSVEDDDSVSQGSGKPFPAPRPVSRPPSHSRKVPPAVGTRFTSDESVRNRRERSPSADSNRRRRI
jgi:hypothetical protein